MFAANEKYENYIKNNPTKYEVVKFQYNQYDIHNGEKNLSL